MSRLPDYSFLDRPEILQFVFYPRHDWTPPPSGASDHLIPVDRDISVFARYYPASRTKACLLYFHGNGEIACDYDWSAPEYGALGISLFVADYRGYGRSDGHPTVAAMIADAPKVFDYFQEAMKTQGETRLFLMGRSLGSQPALEIALSRPGAIAGLIIESGFPSITGVLGHLGFAAEPGRSRQAEETALAAIATITLPSLIIHGDGDTLIPPEEGILLYNRLGSNEKTLRLIKGADHNDIMLVGKKQYYAAIKDFVERHAREEP